MQMAPCELTNWPHPPAHRHHAISGAATRTGSGRGGKGSTRVLGIAVLHHVHRVPVKPVLGGTDERVMGEWG